MKLNLNRPSAALIVASIAIVAALAGGAYAASKIETSDLAKKAVTTKKIAGQAVTKAKLATSERSEGFVTNTPGATPLPAGTSTTVATLNLPAGGSYIVTAHATLGNNAATANLANCELRDDGVKVTAGNGALPALAVFGETITLTGSSDGGAVTLACELDNAGQARERVITAIRVGTLQAQ
jgi:hypothetical protein